ncbi:pseudouridine synthase [Extensimonas vulgaris]|nr:pseudouridine synthase [Extensimonas vulgaris]
MKRIIGAKAKAPAPAARTPERAGAAEARMLQVDEESSGQRLDNFLLRQLKGVPKTHVYRIIRSGEVRVNKGRARADTRVQAGDLVRLPPVRVAARAAGVGTDGGVGGAAEAQAAAQVPARQFPILFEDEYLIALDKPAGVAVHGGSGVSFGVIEQLRRARPEARFLELVHRLDRETSGILLVAKKRSALTRLQDQFRSRATGKTYLALVTGVWPANQKVIDLPLHKYLLPGTPGQAGQGGNAGAGERRVRIARADDPQGQRAITLVQVRRVLPARPQQGLPAMTLLEVTIKTGRTHQIRVHLASQGHPIAGDDKYGDFELNKRLARRGLKRMFLHAWRLDFTHPATDAPVRLHAELPPELADFLQRD